MKDYIVPYLVGSYKTWWSGIDIYNHNDSDSAITIKIYRHFKGVLVNTIKTVIPKYQHYLLLSDVINERLGFEDENSGRATVIVNGPDDLMLTAFHGVNDDKNRTTGFGILKVFESTDIKK